MKDHLVTVSETHDSPRTASMPPSIVPNAEIALIDERAQQLGCGLMQLMERAASAVAEYVLEHFPHKHVLIACGSGNNGGDGYALARLLSEAGQRVSVWSVIPAKSPLCQQQLQSLPKTVSQINKLDKGYGLIIDAILGAGARGQLRPPITTALEQLRALKLPCIAIDVPTGCDQHCALSPAHCITFQVMKEHLVAECTSVVDIGIPSAAYTDTSSVIFRHFPLHHAQSHKGKNGKVFILAGWTFPGARHYCSKAALMSGCDLAHVWVHQTETIDHACVRHEAQHSHLAAVIESCDVLLLGPGMSRAQHPLIAECFQIAKNLNKPCVLDAEAIHHLKYQLRQELKIPLILTPHRAELIALTGQSVFSEAAVHACAGPIKVILAKGPVDFISDGRQWQRNHFGNPRMAVGGTGDILAGLCAGLLARGCSLFDAARLAVYWECLSADQLWQSHGPCYLPEDILNELPHTLRRELSALEMWPPQQH